MRIVPLRVAPVESVSDTALFLVMEVVCLVADVPDDPVVGLHVQVASDQLLDLLTGLADELRVSPVELCGALG